MINGYFFIVNFVLKILRYRSGWQQKQSGLINTLQTN